MGDTRGAGPVYKFLLVPAPSKTTFVIKVLTNTWHDIEWNSVPSETFCIHVNLLIYILCKVWKLSRMPGSEYLFFSAWHMSVSPDSGQWFWRAVGWWLPGEDLVITDLFWGTGFFHTGTERPLTE